MYLQLLIIKQNKKKEKKDSDNDNNSKIKGTRIRKCKNLAYRLELVAQIIVH